MDIVNYDFDLEMIPGLALPQRLNVSKDDIGRTYTAALKWGGVDWTPGSATAKIQGTKPDGAVFDANTTVSGSSVSFTLAEVMAEVSGPVVCQIQFTSSGNKIGSANFIIEVERGAFDPAAPSESELSTFDELYTNAQAALTNANAALANANTTLASIPTDYTTLSNTVNKLDSVSFKPIVYEGYIGANGKLSAQQSTTLELCTDYLSVMPGQKITVTVDLGDTFVSGTTLQWQSVGFYDINKTFISRPTYYNAYQNPDVENYTVPSGAYYCRISWRSYGVNDACTITGPVNLVGTEANSAVAVKSASYKNDTYMTGTMYFYRQGRVITCAYEYDFKAFADNKWIELFTVPAEYRPTRSAVCRIANSSITNFYARVETDGRVRIRSSEAQTAATNGAFTFTYFGQAL